jgi:multidrug efflux pump subunit AcrB
MSDSNRSLLCRQVGIFAIVTATLLVAPRWCHGQFKTQLETRRSGGPSITITVSNPDADAVTLVKTLAVPIESSLQGMERLAQLRSWSTVDGNYRLDMQFPKGASAETCLQRTRDRLETLKAQLPVAVQSTIGIKKTTPELALIVAVTSPNGERDKTFLARYASETLKSALERLPQVSEVSGFGIPTFRQRLRIDASKLKARGVTLLELADAWKSGSDQLPSAPARNQADLENRIVGATAAGEPVLVRDVAQIETVAQWTQANWNAKPVVALGVHAEESVFPRVQETIRQELARLRVDLPTGVELAVAVDFGRVRATARDQPSLLVDLSFPEGTSPNVVSEKLQRFEGILNQLEGVETTFASSTHLFDFPAHRPCILVHCVASRNGALLRDRVAAAIQYKLRAAALDSVFWIRPQSLRGFAYPVQLALIDTSDAGYQALQESANILVRRLRDRTRVFTDVLTHTRAPASRLQVDMNETQMLAASVPARDIRSALQLLGWPRAADFNARRKDLNEFLLRGEGGKLIPLGSLVVVREVLTPSLVQRLDGNPMAEVTANLLAEVVPAQAQTALTRLAADLNLPAAYRLVQFSD